MKIQGTQYHGWNYIAIFFELLADRCDGISAYFWRKS